MHLPESAKTPHTLTCRVSSQSCEIWCHLWYSNSPHKMITLSFTYENDVLSHSDRCSSGLVVSVSCSGKTVEMCVDQVLHCFCFLSILGFEFNWPQHTQNWTGMTGSGIYWIAVERHSTFWQIMHVLRWSIYLYIKLWKWMAFFFTFLNFEISFSNFKINFFFLTFFPNSVNF